MPRATKPNGRAVNSSDTLHENAKHRETKISESTGMDSRKGQRKSGATGVEFQEVTGEERHQLIAEAAYYRAERHSFTPGNELTDWLDAETEIDNMLSRMREGKMHRNA